MGVYRELVGEKVPRAIQHIFWYIYLQLLISVLMVYIQFCYRPIIMINITDQLGLNHETTIHVVCLAPFSISENLTFDSCVKKTIWLTNVLFKLVYLTEEVWFFYPNKTKLLQMFQLVISPRWFRQLLGPAKDTTDYLTNDNSVTWRHMALLCRNGGYRLLVYHVNVPWRYIAWQVNAMASRDIMPRWHPYSFTDRSWQTSYYKPINGWLW